MYEAEQTHHGILTDALRADLEAKGVDIDRTLAVLRLTNAASGGPTTAGACHLPGAETARSRIIDRSGDCHLELPAEVLKSRLEDLGLAGEYRRITEESGSTMVFLSTRTLRRLGVCLYPKAAYGVLNGGSATTYIDPKKNRALSPEAFAVLEANYTRMAEASRGRPKGVSPAFASLSGENGPSFLQLKFRSLLVAALEYRVLSGDEKSPLLPFFQMTSTSTDVPLREAYAAYRNDPLLKDLIERTGVDPTKALGAVQPLLAALTHSSEGLPRRIFSRSGGKENSGLPLPGGHGENFRVLADTYRELRKQGVRYAWLGNVDNSGYTVDPVSLAILALKGASAAFEFSWRTPVDTKGGVLVETENGTLTVADIGQAISMQELLEEEKQGKKALFNCATGLFDLDYLIPRLEAIRDGLPIRVSDQDKEAGRYAQAEQTTWEVLGLLDNPLIFAVDKGERFIAAKTLMETLFASPVSALLELSQTGGPSSVPKEFVRTAKGLRAGFGRLLETSYGYTKQTAEAPRQPESVSSLEKKLARSLK